MRKRLDKHHKSFFVLELLVAACLFCLILVFLIISFDKKNNGLSWFKRSIMIEKKIDTTNLDYNKKVIQEAKTREIARVKEVNDSDHLLGSKSAPVKLIVYFDFECPFCQEYYATLNQILKIYGNQVAIALRHYPLASHPGAIIAAQASECATEQNKYEAMYNLLFSDNREQKQLNQELMLDYASHLKLDKSKFLDCLKQKKVTNKILDQAAEGKSFGVTGTPTTFINGRIFPGAYNLDDIIREDKTIEPGLKKIIDEEIKKIKAK